MTEFSAISATAVIYEAIQPTPLTTRSSSFQSFTSKITSKIKHVRTNTRTSIPAPAVKEVAKPVAAVAEPNPRESTPAPKPVVKEAKPVAPKELVTPKESEKPRSNKDTNAATAIQELESALKKFQAESQLSKSSAEILKIVDTQCAEITEQLRAAVALPSDASDQQSPKKLHTAIDVQATVSKLAALNVRRLELLRILERNAVSMLNAAHVLQNDSTLGCLLSSGTTANVIAELKNAVDHLSKRIFELTFNESTRTEAEQQFEKLRKDAVVLAKLITQNSELESRLCEAAAAVKSKNPDAVTLLTNQLVESRAKESALKDALKQQMQQLEKQCRQYHLAHVLHSMEHLSKHCHFL